MGAIDWKARFEEELRRRQELEQLLQLRSGCESYILQYSRSFGGVPSGGEGSLRSGASPEPSQQPPPQLQSQQQRDSGQDSEGAADVMAEIQANEVDVSGQEAVSIGEQARGCGQEDVTAGDTGTGGEQEGVQGVAFDPMPEGAEWQQGIAVGREDTIDEMLGGVQLGGAMHQPSSSMDEELQLCGLEPGEFQDPDGSGAAGSGGCKPLPAASTSVAGGEEPQQPELAGMRRPGASRPIAIGDRRGSMRADGASSPGEALSASRGSLGSCLASQVLTGAEEVLSRISSSVAGSSPPPSGGAGRGGLAGAAWAAGVGPEPSPSASIRGATPSPSPPPPPQQQQHSPSRDPGGCGCSDTGSESMDGASVSLDDDGGGAGVGAAAAAAMSVAQARSWASNSVKKRQNSINASNQSSRSRSGFRLVATRKRNSTVGLSARSYQPPAEGGSKPTLPVSSPRVSMLEVALGSVQRPGIGSDVANPGQLQQLPSGSGMWAEAGSASADAVAADGRGSGAGAAPGGAAAQQDSPLWNLGVGFSSPSSLMLHWLSCPRTVLVVCKPVPDLLPHLVEVAAAIQQAGADAVVEPAMLQRLRAAISPAAPSAAVAGGARKAARPPLPARRRGSDLSGGLQRVPSPNPGAADGGGSDAEPPRRSPDRGAGAATSSGGGSSSIGAAASADLDALVMREQVLQLAHGVVPLLQSWQPPPGESGGGEAAESVPHMPVSLIDKLDFIVTLGGDGTVIWTCQLLGNNPVPPMVPFAMGSLGFMTPFSISSMPHVLSNVMAGGFPLSLRHRLECFFIRGDQREAHRQHLAASPTGSGHSQNGQRGVSAAMEGPAPGDADYVCLNEVVIDRGMAPALSNVEVWCDDVFVTNVQGDGLIIATPTGSTAYSLSAGGSMVHPEMPGILFTPKCPHSLSFRPLIFPDHVTLRVHIPADARNQGMWCFFDSKAPVWLGSGDDLVVRMSKWPVPTVCDVSASRDWFRSVREGLYWNLRKMQDATWVAPTNGPSTSSATPHPPLA